MRFVGFSDFPNLYVKYFCLLATIQVCSLGPLLKVKGHIGVNCKNAQNMHVTKTVPMRYGAKSQLLFIRLMFSSNIGKYVIKGQHFSKILYTGVKFEWNWFYIVLMALICHLKTELQVYLQPLTFCPVC